MRNLALAATMMMLPVSVSANAPSIFVATNAEKASGFRDLADCQKSLEGPDQASRKAVADKQDGRRGSLFNRTQENTSRCEMVHGEALIVVYPPVHTKGN